MMLKWCLLLVTIISTTISLPVDKVKLKLHFDPEASQEEKAQNVVVVRPSRLRKDDERSSKISVVLRRQPLNARSQRPFERQSNDVVNTTNRGNEPAIEIDPPDQDTNSGPLKLSPSPEFKTSMMTNQYNGLGATQFPQQPTAKHSSLFNLQSPAQSQSKLSLPSVSMSMRPSLPVTPQFPQTQKQSQFQSGPKSPYPHEITGMHPPWLQPEMIQLPWPPMPPGSQPSIQQPGPVKPPQLIMPPGPNDVQLLWQVESSPQIGPPFDMQPKQPWQGRWRTQPPWWCLTRVANWLNTLFASGGTASSSQSSQNHGYLQPPLDENVQLYGEISLSERPQYPPHYDPRNWQIPYDQPSQNWEESSPDEAMILSSQNWEDPKDPQRPWPASSSNEHQSSLPWSPQYEHQQMFGQQYQNTEYINGYKDMSQDPDLSFPQSPYQNGASPDHYNFNQHNLNMFEDIPSIPENHRSTTTGPAASKNKKRNKSERHKQA